MVAGHFSPYLHKQAKLSHLVGPPFLTVKLFSKCGQTVGSQEAMTIKSYGWVWFGLQFCRGWLQGHLCEVHMGAETAK